MGDVLKLLSSVASDIEYSLFYTAPALDIYDEGRWLLVNLFKQMPQILVRVNHFFAPLRGLTNG